MALESAVELAEGGEFLDREVAPAGQDAVPDRTDVPVGEEEQILSATVHGPVRRIDGHLFEVEFH